MSAPLTFIRYDEVSSHDYCKTSEWPAVNDSKWTHQPVAGQCHRITSVVTRFSKHIVIHTPILVQFWSGTEQSPDYTITYASKRDFIKRASRFDQTAITGAGDITEDIQEFVYDFASPPYLWSSVGNLPSGQKKWNKMIVKAQADTPYCKTDGVTPGEMGVFRYAVEIYVDPYYT